MFALRHKETRELAGFTVESNGDAEFCGQVSFEIEKNSDCTWVVDTHEKAERAANTNTEWYNADSDTPSNSYVGEWDVVELVVKYLW